MPAVRPYHHGNLKQALLEAAVQLIAETGPRGFTLREAARRAGVSHNAPYRHFRDRDDLLAAVATDGFDRLTRAMARAAPKASPLNRLRRSGLAYVDFALRWPQHFAAMFDAPWKQPEYPACAAAAQRCFQTLLGFVRDSQAANQMPAGDPERWRTRPGRWCTASPNWPTPDNSLGGRRPKCCASAQALSLPRPLRPPKQS
jgi:AcrR family transcriptional regulator